MTLKERIETLADRGDKLDAAYRLRKLEWFVARLYKESQTFKGPKPPIEEFCTMLALGRVGHDLGVSLT